MIEPWQKLSNNMVPGYTLKDIAKQIGMNGTVVIIEGYNMDNYEKVFNFETLKIYTLWFTAG